MLTVADLDALDAPPASPPVRHRGGPLSVADLDALDAPPFRPEDFYPGSVTRGDLPVPGMAPAPAPRTVRLDPSASRLGDTGYALTPEGRAAVMAGRASVPIGLSAAPAPAEGVRPAPPREVIGEMPAPTAMPPEWQRLEAPEPSRTLRIPATVEPKPEPPRFPGQAEDIAAAYTPPPAVARAIQRTLNNLQAGAVGGVQAGVGMLGMANVMEPQEAEGVARSMDETLGRLSPSDPNFADQVVQGIGSSATLLVMAAAATHHQGPRRRAAMLAGLATPVGRVIATGANQVMEGLTEAGGEYLQALKEGKSQSEATRVGVETLIGNILLLSATAKASLFLLTKKRLLLGIAGVVAGQFTEELGQNLIGREARREPPTPAGGREALRAGGVGGVVGLLFGTAGAIRPAPAAGPDLDAIRRGDTLGTMVPLEEMPERTPRNVGVAMLPDGNVLLYNVTQMQTRAPGVLARDLPGWLADNFQAAEDARKGQHRLRATPRQEPAVPPTVPQEGARGPTPAPQGPAAATAEAPPVPAPPEPAQAPQGAQTAEQQLAAAIQRIIKEQVSAATGQPMQSARQPVSPQPPAPAEEEGPQSSLILAGKAGEAELDLPPPPTPLHREYEEELTYLRDRLNQGERGRRLFVGEYMDQVIGVKSTYPKWIHSLGGTHKLAIKSIEDALAGKNTAGARRALWLAQREREEPDPERVPSLPAGREVTTPDGPGVVENPMRRGVAEVDVRLPSGEIKAYNWRQLAPRAAPEAAAVVAKAQPAAEPLSAEDQAVLDEWTPERLEALAQGPGLEALTPDERAALLEEESRGVSFQRRGPAPGFYSTLERVIAEKMPNAALVPMVRGLLKSPGVRAEEIKWTGLDEWLNQQGDRRITKQELQDFLAANRVEVHEVELGREVSPELIQQRDALMAERERLLKVVATRPAVLAGEVARRQLYENGVKLNEIAKQFLEASKETKFARHTEPGGELYRELLLTLADPDAKRPRPGYRGGHFDEWNVLAHVRFKDRTDADGRRVLFLEEVQSDWHEKGRKKGYQTGGLSQRDSDMAHQLADRAWPSVRRILHRHSLLGFGSPNEAATAIKQHEDWASRWDVTDQADVEAIDAWRAARLEALRIDRELEGWEDRVPPAPFSKSWPELVLKRMLRYAAEHGYDRLAWTTGDTQAKRYDLSQHVDALLWEKLPGSIMLLTGLRDGQIAVRRDIRAAELAQYVGKDLAARIEGSTAESGEFSGLDLQFGGAGMRGFYDQMLPATMNAYAKKWGGRVAPATMATPAGGLAAHAIDITPAMKASVLGEGQPLFRDLQGDVEVTADEVRSGLARGRELPGTGGLRVTDTSEALTDGELRQLQGGAHTASIARMVQDVAQHVAARLRDAGVQLGSVRVYGLSADPRYYGANLAGARNDGTVILNPYALVDAVVKEHGAIATDPTVLSRGLAIEMWNTVVHELAHQNHRDHGVNFEREVARYEAHLAPIKADVVEALRAYFAADQGLLARRLFRDTLRVVTPAWRRYDARAALDAPAGAPAAGERAARAPTPPGSEGGGGGPPPALRSGRGKPPARDGGAAGLGGNRPGAAGPRLFELAWEGRTLQGWRRQTRRLDATTPDAAAAEARAFLADRFQGRYRDATLDGAPLGEAPPPAPTPAADPDLFAAPAAEPEAAPLRFERTPEGEQAMVPGTERREIPKGPIRRAATKPPLESGRSEANLFNQEAVAEQERLEKSQGNLFEYVNGQQGSLSLRPRRTHQPTTGPLADLEAMYDVRKPGVWARTKEAAGRAEEWLVNEYAPLRGLDEAMAAQGQAAAPGESVIERVELVRNKVGGRSQLFALRLNDIIADAEKLQVLPDLRDFLALKQFQKRIRDAASVPNSNVLPNGHYVGGGIYNPRGFDTAKVQDGLQRLSRALGPARMADVDALARRVWALNRGLLVDMHDAGIVSDAAFRLLTGRGEDYVPVRVLDYLEQQIQQGAATLSVRTQDYLRTTKGTERDTEDPLMSTYAKALRAIALAERNRAARAVAELAPHLPGVVDRISGTRFRVAGRGVLSAFVNGTRENYAVPPEIERAMVAMNADQLGLLGTFFEFGRRPLQLGATGANVAFAVPNAVRDVYRFAALSKYGLRGPADLVTIPHDWLRGLYHVVKQDALYEQFLESGGAWSTFQKGVSPERFLRLARGGNLMDRLNLPKHILDAVQYATSTLEETTKVASFIRGLERGGSLADVAYETANYGGSPNFSRAGSAGRALNLLLMFFNARLQGTASNLARVKQSPGRVALTLALMGLLPLTYLYLHNAQYDGDHGLDEIPEDERNRNWIILRGDTYQAADGTVRRKYWKIPKEELAQVLSIPVEAGLDHLRGQKPAAFLELMGRVLGTMSPVQFELKGDRPADVLASLGYGLMAATNPVIGAPAEQLAGMDAFRQQPIEPRRFLDTEPADRSLVTTSPTLVRIARAMERFGVSPLRLQHLVRRTTGGFGESVVEAVDRLGGKRFPDVMTDYEQMARTPVLSRFVGSRGDRRDTETEERFYRFLDEARRAGGSLRLAERAGDEERVEALTTDSPRRAYLQEHLAAYETLARDLKDLRDVVRLLTYESSDPLAARRAGIREAAEARTELLQAARELEQGLRAVVTGGQK